LAGGSSFGQEGRIGGHEKPFLPRDSCMQDERSVTFVGGHVTQSSSTEILSVNSGVTS